MTLIGFAAMAVQPRSRIILSTSNFPLRFSSTSFSCVDNSAHNVNPVLVKEFKNIVIEHDYDIGNNVGRDNVEFFRSPYR